MYIYIFGNELFKQVKSKFICAFCVLFSLLEKQKQTWLYGGCSQACFHSCDLQCVFPSYHVSLLSISRVCQCPPHSEDSVKWSCKMIVLVLLFFFGKIPFCKFSIISLPFSSAKTMHRLPLKVSTVFQISFGLYFC